MQIQLQNLIYFGQIQPDISVYKFAGSTKKYFWGGEKFVKNTRTFTSLCSSISHSIANIDFALVNNLDQFSIPILGKKSLRYRFKQNKKILRLISLSLTKTLFYQKYVLGSSISINNYFIENAPQSDHQFANPRLQIDKTLQPFQEHQDSIEKTLIQAKTFQIKLKYLEKLCHTLPDTKLACANTLYCLFRFYKQNANSNLFVLKN